MSAFFRTAARPLFAKDAQQIDPALSIIQYAFLALLFLSVLRPLSYAESFKNPQWIRTSSTPFSLVEGDINGDGKADLVYAYIDSSFNEFAQVLINNGQGSFTPGQAISFPAAYHGIIQIGDVNTDGHLDVIFATDGNGSPEIVVALGNGDGTFRPLIASAIPPYSPGIGVDAAAKTMQIIDLKGDGVPGIVLSSGQDGNILVCSGDTTGHFTSTATIYNGDGPGLIYPGDYNGDGKTDLIVQEGLGAAATVYLNKGDGTFLPGARYTGVDHISSIFVRDVDGDGRADMVVTDFSNQLDILHGNPDGTFTATKSIPITVGAYEMFPALIDIEDYNADDILDVALQSLDGVHVLLGKGDFSFQPLAPAPVATFPGPPAIGDLNQDGQIDFAFPIYGGIAILYGQPGGSLHSADAYDVGYVVSSAVLSDFNGDHNADLAVAVDSLNPRILLANADGTFALQPDTNTSAGGENAGTFVDAGDFNGDGHPDLLVNGSKIFFPESPALPINSAQAMAPSAHLPEFPVTPAPTIPAPADLLPEMLTTMDAPIFWLARMCF